MELIAGTDDHFERALASRDPLGNLRIVVAGLLERHPRLAVSAELERFREDLRTSGRQTEEDLILDILDFVEGWCGPHMKL